MIKYFLFFLLSFGFITLGVFACRLHKQAIQLIFGLMIFSSIWSLGYSSISFMHHEWYKSATTGFDITLVDLCIIVIAINMFLRPKEYPIRWFIPLTIPNFILFLVYFISWMSLENSEIPNNHPEAVLNGLGGKYILPDAVFELWLFPLFEIWKLVRFFVSYWVLTNFIANTKCLKTIILSFSFMIVYLTVRALIERYYYGFYQVSVGLGKHDLNAVAAVLGSFILPFMFVQKKLTKKLLYLFLITCCLVIVLLTVGRAAIFAYVLSILIGTTLCFVKYRTFGNFIIISLMFLAFLGLFVKVANTLGQRLNEESNEYSFAEREEKNSYSIAMAQDHLFGVGPGNFSAMSADVYRTNMQEVFSIAHNGWYLILGEAGYPGVLAYAIIVLRYFQILIIDFFKKDKNDVIYLLLVGVLCVFCVFHIENYLHFAFRRNDLNLYMQIMTAIISRIYYDTKKMRNMELP